MDLSRMFYWSDNFLMEANIHKNIYYGTLIFAKRLSEFSLGMTFRVKCISLKKHMTEILFHSKMQS